ncbi:MAG TPA: hypothetical protein VI814_12330 [Candidatus Limnocylindria bacterium]
MTAVRTTPTARDTRPAGPRGQAAAGIDLSAGVVHVVVAAKEGARLRVVGRADAQLAESAVSGGLVADRDVTADALRNALAIAEHAQRAERSVVAIDGDDVRTFHMVTAFEREDSSSAVSTGEESRAIREATADATARAQAAILDDAALRGTPAARLHDDVAALALDGRVLRSLVGHRGRLVEVWTDVTIAPLVITGAATAALEATRRRGGVVSASYALGRLLAESGITDGGVVRLGADATSIVVLRESRVAATRVFALGRTAIAERPERRDDDARVWAECVVASLRGVDGPPPGRWIFVGVPETLRALPAALGKAVSDIRGDDVETTPLTVGMASRVFGDLPLHADDLVAAGAVALATGVYEA